MISRPGLVSLILCGWLQLSAADAVSAELKLPAPTRKPNVIVIFVDDLGYADLGCQGSTEVRTPHIDSIAREGVRLTNGYVTAPQCGPSRAGLMTGIYQQRFGFEGNAEREYLMQFGLPDGLLTMADRLRGAGLKTAGFGKWDLGAIPSSRPWNRGFDEFNGFYTGSRSFWPVNDNNPNSYVRFRKSGDELLPEKGHLTGVLTDAAVQFIRSHQSTPFFLYLPYNAPHWPMEPAPEHLEMFSHIPDHHRRHFLALLYGVDQGVGRILSTLRELSLDEDTLLIFLSDNGGPTGKPRRSFDAAFDYGQNTSLNTPLRGVKGDLYEGGIRVPFLIRWKGTLPENQEFHHPVISLDLLPTALAAAGVTVGDDAGLDGANLLPHLTGEVQSPPHDVLYWRWLGQLAIRCGDWKLVRLPDRRVELFDLSSDISEINDLSKKHPETVDQLQKRLISWSSQLSEPKWRTPKQMEMIRKSYLP